MATAIVHTPMVMDTAIGPTAITVHRPIMADSMAIMVVHMPITVGLMATTVVPESASALPSEATGKKGRSEIAPALQTVRPCVRGAQGLAATMEATIAESCGGHRAALH